MEQSLQGGWGRQRGEQICNECVPGAPPGTGSPKQLHHTWLLLPASGYMSGKNIENRQQATWVPTLIALKLLLYVCICQFVDWLVCFFT